MSNFQKGKFFFLIITAYIIGNMKIAGMGLAVVAMSAIGMESLLELLLAAKDGRFSGILRRFLIVCALMIFFIIVAIVINLTSIEDLAGTIRRLIYICCCMTVCGSLVLQIQSTDDIKYIINIYIMITTLSSFFVIVQAFNMSWAWGLARTGIDEMEEYSSAQRFSGLSPSVIVYAYQCSATLAYLIIRGRKNTSRILFSSTFFINAIALVLNRTRSALFAVIIVSIYGFAFSKRNFITKMLLIFTTILAAVIIILASDGTINFENNLSFIMRSDEIASRGSMARIPMFLTGFNHALHNPFGVGEYHANPNLMVGTTAQTESYVLSYGCHNLIANCVANYGFFGLSVMLYLYYRLFVYYRRCTSVAMFDLTEQETISGLGKGILAAILVSVFNGCFHNSYILAEDVASWVFFGLLIALTEIVDFNTRETGHESEQGSL